KLDGDLSDATGNGLDLDNFSANNGAFVTPTAGFRCAYVQNSGPYTFNSARFLPLAALQDVTVQVLVLAGNNSSTQSTLLRVGTSNPTHFHLRASNTSTIFSYTNSTNTGDVVVTGPAIPIGEWNLEIGRASCRERVKMKLVS